MSKRRQPESKEEPPAKEQRVETESDEEESDQEEKSTNEEIEEEIQGELELCNCKFKTKDKLDDATKRSRWRSCLFVDMICCAYTDHTNEVEIRYFIIPSEFALLLGLSKMISKWITRKEYPKLVHYPKKDFHFAWDILEQFMFYGIEIKFDELPKYELNKSFVIKVCSD